MENRFESFTITVLKINKLIHKIKQREMYEYDLKAIHVMCLYFLNERKTGYTASELMRLTCEDKAAISRALKLLRDKSLADYDPDSYNAPVKLTQRGSAVAQEIILKIDKAVNAVSAEFTDFERKFFYESLNAIADNLSRYYKELTNADD
ncbi:MAG: hypothetical protein NC099_00320 [Corallococcus sp.]|nr:hypothetical protein [Bacillota bacterium]MCM1533079.1 hypothetical protein [Corallococcus sp.]